jgi:membrane protein
VFSVLFFSQSIISDEKSYSPAGVVMILLSCMIAFGVVVHLGAVAGRQWIERHAAAPANRPRRPNR